jgi:hypothetical protein
MNCSHYDVELDNPCTCSMFPIACPRVVDYYDDCLAMFQPFYDKNTCLDGDSGSSPASSYSFTGFYYRMCYIWIVAVSMLVIAWCFFNEKLCHRSDQTSLPMLTAESRKETPGAWVQIGYQRTIIGTAIYGLVLLTAIGIQVLLLILCILYNIQNGTITRWSPVFETMAQVEKTFILVWLVGFPWTLSLKYIQAGLETLFLRRCLVCDATHIAVVAPSRIDANPHNRTSGHISRTVLSPISAALRFIFSYPYGLPGMEVAFCQVQFDEQSGTRGFNHRLRRYVFDEATGGYIPGRIDVGKKVCSFLDKSNGLRTHDAIQRLGIVGPNKAPMQKPTLLKSLREEFSRPFYVYQVCIHCVGLVQ